MTNIVIFNQKETVMEVDFLEIINPNIKLYSSFLILDAAHRMAACPFEVVCIGIATPEGQAARRVSATCGTRPVEAIGTKIAGRSIPVDVEACQGEFK